MLTVASVNVNGLRAAMGKGMAQWLADTRPDVLCLQEVRAGLAHVPPGLGEQDGWHAAHAVSSRPGRAGVAVLTRRPPESVRVGFDVAEFDTAGRYLEVWLPGLVVASVYVPTGEAGTPRQQEKERFLTGLEAHLAGLAGRSGRAVLVCGDFNIAHREADLRAWRANRGRAGFLPEERAWLDRLYDRLGYVDVVRRLHPGVEGPYTWWSYRGRAFDNDAGWRIDLQLATPDLAARAVRARVDRAAAYDQRFSDHAPVVVAYDVADGADGAGGADGADGAAVSSHS